jgi:hypothetical protein
MQKTDDPVKLMPDRELREYSLKLAAVAVDSLLDAGFVAKANSAGARLVAAVELYVRFSMRDMPPRKPSPKTDDAPRPSA